MRLDWLEDIVALLEADTLTEAAQRRNISQPAFSRRLRAAEEALGVSLLDRSVKPVRLRPGILALGPRLSAAAGDIRQLRVDLRLAAAEGAGRLVIAAQHSLATTRAAGIVEQLGGLGEVQSVRLRSANRDDCIDMIMSGGADFALVHRSPAEQLWPRPSEVEIAGLAAERLIPVATKTEAARLAGGCLRLVAFPGDVFLGQVFAVRIAPRLPAHLVLEQRAETALAPAAHSLAREGSGVAWLPESMCRADVASGHLTDMSGDLPSTVLDLCAVRTLRPPSPASAAAWSRLVTETP